MTVEFTSALPLENKPKKTILDIILTIVGIAVALCFLIKIIVGDFEFGELAIFLGLFGFILLRRKRPKTFEYVNGKITFAEEHLTISYSKEEDVENISLPEDKIIPYKEIKFVEYDEILELIDIHLENDAEQITVYIAEIELAEQIKQAIEEHIKM